jgi:xanthine dehydrogenase accessory factor
MSDQTSVLVSGLNETASAVARMLFLAGFVTAIHQPTPPAALRRKMSFADAWYDGVAILDGVEARRVDLSCDLLVGLRNRTFIPLLTHSAIDVERWAWDVIVDAGMAGERAPDLIESHAALTIALGPGHVAGAGCDLVIETYGPDAGAIIRHGAARYRPSAGAGEILDDARVAVALENGIFATDRVIGETVRAREPLGIVGSTPVLSPAAGRIRGLQRNGRAVIAGEAVADIAARAAAQVSGAGKAHQLIARGVVFAIETELDGQRPLSLDKFLSRRRASS